MIALYIKYHIGKFLFGLITLGLLAVVLGVITLFDGR